MRRRSKQYRKKGFIWTFFKILVILGIILGGIITIWVATFDIPDLETFEERKVLQSAKIYDRTGEILLYEFNNRDIQRTLVSYDNISRHIKNASVAIEDSEFYEHIGIRPIATFRAVFIQPLRGKGVQGGSTITQQVIKNSILTSEKKVSRKLKEWVLAVRLEQSLTKNEILELYLNEVPYGGSIYGIGEAAQTFFGTEANDVTLAQAAYLAALPQAPTFYSPYGNNREALEDRKDLVLEKMLENEFITEQEYKSALEEVIVFEPRATLGIRAPHFVFFIGEYLENKYGTKAIEESGLKVITTLDYSLQEKAEEIVKKFALENAENFNAENASLVAIDPKTGQILVMVGSRDYFDEEIDGNFNITLTHRQPGSAFKPFVYAAAFKKGYTPETVVFNLETEFSTQCSSDSKPLGSDAVCYRPVNYDGVFSGPVTLREALAQSINIPAIKTLYLAGLSDSLRLAKDMGITSLTNINQYGLTLVLGGGEVSPLEMASAYGVFANDGVRVPHTGILRVEDSRGNVFENFELREQRAIPENIARTISDILSDNVARAPAFGHNSPLYFPTRDVAVKTGTTNDFRDAWTVGYTPNLAVAAWAGNNDNSSMEKKVAGFIITPLWRSFMNEALSVIPDEKFKSQKTIDDSEFPPQLRGIWEGGETYIIDTISSKLATDLTPEETRKEMVITNPHTILYWIDKDNPRSNNKINPKDSSQFRLWEPPVLKWVEENGIKIEDESVIPKEVDDVHTNSSLPNISISVLKPEYTRNERVVFNVINQGQYLLRQVEVFFNNKYVGRIDRAPFNFSFSLSDFSVGNKNTLRVVGVDSIYNKGESFTTIVIK